MNDNLELEDILGLFYTKVLGEAVRKDKIVYNERLNKGRRYMIESALSKPDIPNNRIREWRDLLNGDELVDLSDIAAFYKNSSCKKVYQKLSEQLYKDLVTDEEIPVEDLDLDSGEVAIIEHAYNYTRSDGSILSSEHYISVVNHNKIISAYITLGHKYIHPTLIHGYGDSRYTRPVAFTKIREYDEHGTYSCEIRNIQILDKVAHIEYRADTDRNPHFTQEELVGLKREWLLKTGPEMSKLECSDANTPKSAYSFDYDIGYDEQTEKSPDALKVASKLFNIGLAEYVSNPSYRHDILKIEDNERATYDLSDAEQALLSTTQKLDTTYEVRKKAEAKKPEEAKKQEEAKRPEPLFQFQEEELPLAIQALYNAKANDIELSESQERTLQIYEKLNSEKFREFKAQAQERARKQAERRKAVQEENAKKEEWLNSADNPINMRLAELKKTRNQVAALEGIKDAGLIVPNQEQKLDNLSEFLEMFEKTSQEQHEVDTGMSDESRAWYQEHYRAK